MFEDTFVETDGGKAYRNSTHPRLSAVDSSTAQDCEAQKKVKKINREISILLAT